MKPHPLALAALALLLFLLPLPLSAERLDFSEIWAYLMDGEERYLDPALPISDLAYFGAGINSQGRLSGIPDRSRLGAYPGRVHLVIAELGNYALLHFCMDPSLPLREVLIADIVQGAAAFDGVQIDFESVAAKDYDNYQEFIRLLKAGLGSKTLSVALPACTKPELDRFGYERVGAVADKVVIMAYDEHWSGSEPGPVSSLEWSRKVAAYALSRLAPAKLVMGSPLYGRAWADKSLSRAYKYSSLAGLLGEKPQVPIQRQEGIPFAEYQETVTVKVFFDDAASLAARLGDWRLATVRNIGFWRLGQEDPALWPSLALTPRAQDLAAGPAGAGK